MLIRELKELLLNSLKDLYPPLEIQSFFALLCEHRLNFDRAQTIIHKDDILEKKDVDFFKNAIDKLQKFVPIQYILGQTAFYNLKFEVDKNVLIPRPETEELVDWIISDTSSYKSSTILDIGTGSGCIAISLAKNLPKSDVHAYDISKNALEVAKKNNSINNTHVHFYHKDIFNSTILGSFDIIVSNPPYVREMEKQLMQPNVLNHEPEIALFVKDDDPLLYYKKIAALSKKSLNNGGKLYFEINQYLHKEIEELLITHKFKNITLKKDIFGAYRMVRAEI